MSKPIKLFLDLGVDPNGPIRQVIMQIFTTIAQLEFVSNVDEADGIIVDEPIKAWEYFNSTSKRVAQVLMWEQRPAEIPPSERFRVFDVLPSPTRGSLPGLIEAITFLKGD